METKIVNKSTNTRVTAATDVAAKCRAAKEMIDSGEYEAAREALEGLWCGIGERPQIEGLSPADQAEVLLRVGALSGWLGSSGQISGAQEFAKDLISESIRAYEALDNREKVAEAQNDLAICYWREGAMDEARVWFREALSRAKEPSNLLRALVNSTIVEFSTNHMQEAFAILDRAAPLLDGIQEPAPIGRYHMQRALVLKGLGGADNLDRALIENAAARIHFELANHRRYSARVDNNTGEVLMLLGRYDEALDHLERARGTFVELGDVGTAAQVNETRARVFLAQRRYVEAEKVAFASASALDNGGEQSLLAEALEAQGIALARMGRYQSALGILKRAAHIAETAGHSQLSGKVGLTILEELRNSLSPNEIGSLYQEADRRLGDRLDADTLSRLRRCARLAITNTVVSGTDSATDRGSFEEEVHKCESELIRHALDEASGSVTRAARVLGLTHQGLCYIINHRHQQLLTARAPIRVRRKSLIRKR